LSGGLHTKVRMTLSLPSSESFLMVITQELVQKVDGFVRDIPLVLGCNKPRPWPLSVAAVERVSVLGGEKSSGE
jgi:hypothetical protein